MLWLCLIFLSGGRIILRNVLILTFLPPQPSRDWTSQRSDLVKVEIARDKHSLGMVIEGGTDTSQQEARIINILPGGAAFETGGLRVGQIIKEVEGLSLKGWGKILLRNMEEINKFVKIFFFCSHLLLIY